MRTPQRRLDPPVIGQLQREPHRFGFFQAVRMLESMFLRRQERDGQHRLVPGERMVPQRLRFSNTLNLAFPASEIAALVVRDRHGEALPEADWALPVGAEGAVERVDITPAFFGLLGTMGALPTAYTELLARREQHHRDDAARAFLDIFTDRATALFYAAWYKYRLPLHFEHERSRAYLPLMLSLAGLPHPAQRQALHEGDGRIFDETVAGYAAAVQCKPMSAVYLQRVLSDYFRSTIRIEQFVGKWYAVPPAQMSQLGGTNATLGRTALAGARIWQRDLRIRLWIGPLQRTAFLAFFPGRPHALALEKTLALLCGATCEYEVRLILAKEAVSSVTLDAQRGSHLGWDSFLATRPATADRSDATYDLAPLQ